jgi:hypothetical protein
MQISGARQSLDQGQPAGGPASCWADSAEATGMYQDSCPGSELTALSGRLCPRPLFPRIQEEVVHCSDVRNLVVSHPLL